MPGIFACVATAQLLILVGAGVLGLLAHEYSVDRHVVLALFFLLLNCLMQVVLFTYFTVAGKMISQAVHLGGFGPEAVEKTKVLKRNVLLAVFGVFVAMVFSTATGAWTWRDVSGGRDGQGGQAHLLAAGVILLAHTMLCYREFVLATRMASLLRDTLAAYTAKAERRRADG